METHVRGRFHDADRVARAVDLLLERKIPEDQVAVTVEDAHGREIREIPVKERMGALRGALWGGVGGAAFGMAAVLVLSVGALDFVGVDPLLDGVLVGMVRAAVAGAVAGVPIGGVLAMTDWRGVDDLRKEDLEEGAAVVTVRGDGLVERARDSLEEAGAETIEA